MFISIKKMKIYREFVNLSKKNVINRRLVLFYFVFKFIIYNFGGDINVVMKDKLDNDKIVNKFL